MNFGQLTYEMIRMADDIPGARDQNKSIIEGEIGSLLSPLFYWSRAVVTRNPRTSHLVKRTDQLPIGGIGTAPECVRSRLALLTGYARGYILIDMIIFTYTSMLTASKGRNEFQFTGLKRVIPMYCTMMTSVGLRWLLSRKRR